MGKFLTTEIFIEKAYMIHFDDYDYSYVTYVDSKTKIKIICPVHGFFEQTPNSHLSGYGCKKCHTSSMTKTTEQFIKEAKEVHGDKYDYSLVKYVNANTRIKIICPEDGIYEQFPHVHLKGHKRGFKHLTTESFIEKAQATHGDRYDYSLVYYIDGTTPVKIICPEHGIFKQRPDRHYWWGIGCRICSASKNEQLIHSILTLNKLEFEMGYSFDDCKHILPLRFDFYLMNYNICIEYDGVQHFKEIKKWGGKEKLKMNQKRDKIKNKYCKDNDIPLIRINYKEKNNLEEKLISELKKYKVI